jgi:hypothetical protein
MESISIRNKKLKYYVIMYFWNEKENVYYIISTNETTALNYFFVENLLIGILLKREDILSIKELDMMNPN